MWGSLDDLRVCACLLGDLPQDTDKVIQGLASLCFGWLDHQRLVDDQGEVDGWSVHAKVEDALGDVERCDTIFVLLALCRSNELMLADQRIRDLIVRFQLVFEVVRVENGALRNMQKPIGAIGANVCIGTHQHAEVAIVGADFTNRLRSLISPIIPIISPRRQRARQERYKMFFDANWTCAWATSTMGSATCLMQIEMYHVEAHVTWASNTEYRVGIGSIIVELSSNVMHHRRNLQNIAIKES